MSVFDSARSALRVVRRRLQQPGRIPIRDTVTVAGKLVTELFPLGGYRTPGLTKVGRLSFRGVCEGRVVKVFSVARPEQAMLRQELQDCSNELWAFPPIIAIDSSLVVEAWIEGTPVRSFAANERHHARSAIKAFFSSSWGGRRMAAIAASHRRTFCYMEDYLLPRLGPWRHLDSVARFVSVWQESYRQLDLPDFVSHADLSADNVLIETGTNRVMFIDNELLGVGKGWILDPLNSFLGDEFDVVREAPVPVDRGFVELTWALRKAGSAFDAGEPGRAVELMRAALARFEKGGAR